MKVIAVVLIAISISLAQGEVVSNVCESCIAQASGLSNKVSTQYRDFLLVKERVCSGLPPASRPACEQLLEASLPVLRNAFTQPIQACERIGACSKKEEVFSLLQQRSVGDDVTCPICEYVVVYLKEQLEDPETEEQLVEQATQVCKLLPEDLQTECLQEIAAYSSQIFAFIHESTPLEVCQMATLCDASNALPELPPSLKSKASQLFETEVSDDDECNTCKLVIVQIASALADPKTQKEILAYAKQQCQDFQAFQDQCEAYVDLYGALALNMARQYLSPDICDQLGFCPSPSAEEVLAFSA